MFLPTTEVASFVLLPALTITSFVEEAAEAVFVVKFPQNSAATAQQVKGLPQKAKIAREHPPTDSEKEASVTERSINVRFKPNEAIAAVEGLEASSSI